MEKLKIFISGTQEDMKRERNAVDRAVNATTLSTGIRAETTVSQPQSPRVWIEQQIRECNIYIGVYSHRYGWVIPGENVSATEFEFNLARKLQKPILVWIRTLRDEEKAKPDFDRQKQFLSRVSDFSTGYLRQVFDDPVDLERWVTAALPETFTEIIRRGTAPSTSKFLVPFPHNPDFVGRDAELTSLHEMLQHGGSIVGIRPTVLVGLGGIGKTQLAVEYAHAHRDDYPSGVFWLNAIEPLVLEFARLAEKLELADAETPRDRAAQRAWEYLNQHTDALVIFDNVLEPADLNIPFANALIPANLQCRTLFTTRKRDFPRTFQPFEVKILSESAAMHLLLRHPTRQPILDSNHPDHGLGRIICITLGYLPLALELAAAFLSEYPTISLYDYRVRLLDEGAIEVVDATDVRPEEMPTRHETAVRATLRTSWDALRDEGARLALRAAGQLRVAELIPIPSLGLLTGLEASSRPGYASPLDRALKKLYAGSLIEELTSDRLRLHPLVHAFASQLSPPTFRAEMASRVANTFDDLPTLQTAVIQHGIDQVLEDLRTGLELHAPNVEDDLAFTKLSSLERVLGQEAHHLRDWNPKQEPAFFLQQFRNHSLELGYGDLISRADVQLAERRLPHLRERFPVSRESKAMFRTLTGHTDEVYAVAVTADGRWVVSGSRDMTLKVWDLATGQAIRTIEGHRGSVTCVVVTADGRWAVSACTDDLKVWDLTTGQAVHTLEGHTSWVHDVAVTADGRWAVSASADETLKVWDLTTGQAVRTLEEHAPVEHRVAVTADGRWAISTSKDWTLKVWELTTGQAIRTLEGHSWAVTDVDVTSDGLRAVSASKDKTLKVWDLATGETIHTLEGHTDEVYAVAVAADGHWAVSASEDKTLKVWDLATGDAIHTFDWSAPVTDLVITADGRWAISASSDKTLKVWDLTTDQRVHTTEGHSDQVTGVTVTGDGHWAVSASHDKTLKVWDIATGQALHTLEGHSEGVTDVDVTSDGLQAVSVSYDGRLKVWDLTTGQAIYTFRESMDSLNGVAVTADGSRAIAASSDKNLYVWDLTTGEWLQTLEGGTRLIRDVAVPVGHMFRVNRVAVTADGHWVVSASEDDYLIVWDLTGRRRNRVLSGHTGSVRGVAVTADGRWVVSASNDQTLKLWDLTQPLEEWEKTRALPALKTARTFKGHTSWVHDVAVTADGRWAVSASDDQTLKVWDLTGQTVLTLASTVSFECCAFAPDSKIIVAGDDVGAVHFIEWVKY